MMWHISKALQETVSKTSVGIDFKAVQNVYPNNIITNEGDLFRGSIQMDKRVLIGFIKTDNVDFYLDSSAKIYYTGKRFPSTVALNKLYYFMPYIKGKGIRDLYLIKVARVGTRKEGQPENDPNDFRLVFEIEYIDRLFDDFQPIRLEIWRAFTDTTMTNLLSNIKNN